MRRRRQHKYPGAKTTKHMARGRKVGSTLVDFSKLTLPPTVAVITTDPASLARLLQARDHLRAASNYLHPARWDVIYAPQLRILEEDVLTRFSARELTAAEAVRCALPSLPELR
jgi:hypothetical protein